MPAWLASHCQRDEGAIGATRWVGGQAGGGTWSGERKRSQRGLSEARPAPINLSLQGL